MSDPVEPVVPERCALLIMDLQNRMAGGIEDPDALVARISRARDAARAAGAAVIYIRVALSDEDAAAIPDRNRTFAPMGASGALRDGDPSLEIVADLAPGEGEPVVRKVRVGAFSTTELATTLRERGIDTLALCGISTSGVVLSTTRDAADRDYRLLVLGDCCADRDPEAHRVLLERVFPKQADVIDVERLEALLS